MVVVKTPSEGKPSMGKSIRNLSTVTRVGLDLAKRVFQVHAVEAKGEIVVARVRRNKSDQVDAAAIYEAMSRPGQRKLTRSQLIPFFAELPPPPASAGIARALSNADRPASRQATSIAPAPAGWLQTCFNPSALQRGACLHRRARGLQS
jgi:transposase